MFPEIHLWVFRAVAFIFGNDLCGKNCCFTVGFLPSFRRLYRKFLFVFHNQLLIILLCLSKLQN